MAVETAKLSADRPADGARSAQGASGLVCRFGGLRHSPPPGTAIPALVFLGRDGGRGRPGVWRDGGVSSFSR